MRILAIESSAVTASVAILTDDVLTAEYTVNYKKTHSQTLLPMLKEIGDMINLDLNSLEGGLTSNGAGKGWVLVCAGDYSLGWAKLTGQIFKNHYPKGLRWV